MLNAVRSTKPQASSYLTATNLGNIGRKVSPVIGTVRFNQASAGTGANQAKPSNMDKMQPSKESDEKGDVMSHSFGDGYATRSDEEGFGGMCGGSANLSKEDQDKIVHANSPEYDKSQGSKVKETEQSRNQK